eukprot:SAG11_NODE_2409_length_3396_cov_1.523506_3_plen_150_part_00
MSVVSRSWCDGARQIAHQIAVVSYGDHPCRGHAVAQVLSLAVQAAGGRSVLPLVGIELHPLMALGVEIIALQVPRSPHPGPTLRIPSAADHVRPPVGLQLMVPQASLLGHVSGVLAGLSFAWLFPLAGGRRRGRGRRSARRVVRGGVLG